MAVRKMQGTWLSVGHKGTEAGRLQDKATTVPLGLALWPVYMNGLYALVLLTHSSHLLHAPRLCRPQTMGAGYRPGRGGRVPHRPPAPNPRQGGNQIGAWQGYNQIQHTNAADLM